MHARVALRERSLLDVIDLSMRFSAANAGAYVKLAAVTIAPSFAVSWAAARFAGWLFAWPLALVLAALVDAPFVELASKLVFTREARVRDVLRASGAVLPRLLIARSVQGMAFLLSFLLGGVPWLWFGGVLLFLPEVVILERSHVGAASLRARRLTQARLGVAVAAVLLLSTLTVGAALVADAAGREVLQDILQIRPPPSVFTEGGSTLALLGFWLVLPLRATTRFFVYLDIRTRAEGWDIQTRFAALAARAAAQAAPPRDLLPGPAAS
jgi:hypothetical protein